MAEGIKPRGRQWKPGESGNPKGRPKGTKNKKKGMTLNIEGLNKSIATDLIREYLEDSQEIVIIVRRRR